MAKKRIVVKIPQGTSLDALSPDQIKDLVDKAAGSAGITDIDELVVHSGDDAPKVMDVGPWVAWTRSC